MKQFSLIAALLLLCSYIAYAQISGGSLSGVPLVIASGTGACATTSTKIGSAFAGSFVCTGTTGVSTVVLTLPATGNGYICLGRDITNNTSVTQTGTASPTAVTLHFTSVTQNDIIQFGCPSNY